MTIGTTHSPIEVPPAPVTAEATALQAAVESVIARQTLERLRADPDAWALTRLQNILLIAEQDQGMRIYMNTQITLMNDYARSRGFEVL